MPFKPPFWNKSASNYLGLWGMRSYLSDKMGWEGIEELRADSEASLSGFFSSIPDIKSQLPRLRATLLAKQAAKPTAAKLSVAKFCAAIGTPVVPAYVSYLVCFASDPGFQDSDFEDFAVEKWWACAERYYRKHKVEPHPAWIAQSIRQQADRAES